MGKEHDKQANEGEVYYGKEYLDTYLRNALSSSESGNGNQGTTAGSNPPRHDPAREANSRPTPPRDNGFPRAGHTPAQDSTEIEDESILGSVRIGIWGGPLTGKTTYLAALRLAALLFTGDGWLVSTAPTPGSTSLDPDPLLPLMEELLNRQFPPLGTLDTTRFSYIVSGLLPPELLEILEQRWGYKLRLRQVLRRLRVMKNVSFNLTMWDYPGANFYELMQRDTPERQALLKYLASCNGLIYLYDPTSPDNFHYLNTAIDLLWTYMHREGLLVEEKLPHYVAVCVTKFDEQKVMNIVHGANLVDRIWSGMPYPSDPKAAFELLTPTIQGEVIRKTLTSRFLPDRMKYYMTSAIGFYRNPKTGEIDLADCTNAEALEDDGASDDEEDQDGATVRGDDDASVQLMPTKVLRSDPDPLNVLDPLIWVYRRVSKLQKRPIPALGHAQRVQPATNAAPWGRRDGRAARNQGRGQPRPGKQRVPKQSNWR